MASNEKDAPAQHVEQEDAKMPSKRKREAKADWKEEHQIKMRLIHNQDQIDNLFA